jgi:hypothetical protein
MVHLQAPDYSVPWADEEFIDKFGPIENRMCYEIMHGRNSPCETCPTFKSFETKKPVISAWHRKNGQTFMTVVEPLSHELPLLVEFAVEYKLASNINPPRTIKSKKKRVESSVPSY